MNITRQAVKFDNHGHKIAGILRIPEDAQEKKNAALVCIHPGSSCKEQTAGIYAEKMAEQGYVTLPAREKAKANPATPKSPLCEWKMFIAQWITCPPSLL